jgi:hypothetical protein
MTTARKILLLLCVMFVPVQGCAAHGSHDLPADGGLRPTVLRPTGNEGEVAVVAVYMAAGALVVVSLALCAVADLFCLPFAIAGYFDPFPCCRGLFDLCESLF